ncbi:MAG TPA: Clp protease N-terminal domain-containing protein [Fimbriimonas sp.]|nr:Clp protease N-terminal domain-containing protein [Fimbriimonas sp.]
MWQRFTERARKIVFYAQEEAQKFGEGYVSTEHLLLGLTRGSDTTAARVLEDHGISISTVRAEVEKQLPQGDNRPNQDMSLTLRAKRVIDLSYDEARNLNNNYIGTEHLLLGLIREGDGLAGRVLAKLGVDLEWVRERIAQIQQSEGRQNVTYPESYGHASTYVRPNHPSYTTDWSKYPLVSELFYALLNDSEEDVDNKMVELKTNLPALKAEIAKLLLNQ